MRVNMWGRLVLLCLVVGLAGVACSDDDDKKGTGNNQQADATGDTTGQPDAGGDAEDDVAPPDDEFVQPDCDDLQPSHCVLPWPSNLYLKADAARATGYTLNFGAESLPKSKDGMQTRPDNWRRLDGYGPGTPLLVHFEGLDISGMPNELHIEKSLDDDAQVVWLEVDAHNAVVRKIPYFVEFDTRPEVKKEKDRLLFVRPAVILNEATRYVVAFRNLKTEAGQAIAPRAAFQKLLDGAAGDDKVLASRQARFDEVFGVLTGAGIEKSELTLAWDFVTGSSKALHGPMLSIRDQGFEIAGDQGPELVFTEVKENTEAENTHWWLEIKGTFDSPHFMKDAEIDETPGVVMNLDADGKPVAEGVHTQPFWLYVPHSARSGEPHGLIQYGHGLLGQGSQTGGGHNGRIANDHHFIFFGTSLAGMSEEDMPNAAFALGNLNGFPFMVDRQHQGLLEYLLLARSMRERLGAKQEISSRNIQVNADELYYSGISQGGIFGGTYMALSTDVTQGHLGVPGNNYSTLLHRSTDFNLYAVVMNVSYPNPADQVVGISALQLLWDQTDPVSYLRHITAEPFANTPKHYALFVPAKGDYQVSVMTNEIAARSDIGIELMEHYGHDVALVTPKPYPYVGSGVVLYDFGNPWPAPGNIPPSDEFGDPHGKPRKEAHHNEQMVHFFRNGGEIIDVCGGDPCTPD